MRREIFCWKYRKWVEVCPLKNPSECLIRCELKQTLQRTVN